MYKRKSWKEKLLVDKKPELKTVLKKFADIPAGSKMLIPTPRVVDDYIRHIPTGSTSTISKMRRDLAIEFGADYTCPVTSGIFLRIAAEAAFEDYQKVKSVKKITPFWRMIEPGSATAKKLTFGQGLLNQLQRKENLSWKKS